APRRAGLALPAARGGARGKAPDCPSSRLRERPDSRGDAAMCRGGEGVTQRAAKPRTGKIANGKAANR
ncbi:hypothetical protein, partial [Burkholderia pseudomallei]